MQSAEEATKERNAISRTDIEIIIIIIELVMKGFRGQRHGWLLVGMMMLQVINSVMIIHVSGVSV